jgi:UDP-N-acetyl-D-mannosaminuronate dehydrogenase
LINVVDQVSTSFGLSFKADIDDLIDHKEFQAIKPETLQDKNVIDTRGMWR